MPFATNTFTLPFAIQVEPILVVSRSIGASVATTELDEDDEATSELELELDNNELDEVATSELALETTDELELFGLDDTADE